MKPYFPPNAIGLWVRNPGKPIISNALIAPSDNEFPDWLEKRCHFQKNLLIILVAFGTLFIITMQRFRLIKQGKESFGFQDYLQFLHPGNRYIHCLLRIDLSLQDVLELAEPASQISVAIRPVRFSRR